jgi:hypothetical protein
LLVFARVFAAGGCGWRDRVAGRGFDAFARLAGLLAARRAAFAAPARLVEATLRLALGLFRCLPERWPPERPRAGAADLLCGTRLRLAMTHPLETLTVLR